MNNALKLEPNDFLVASEYQFTTVEQKALVAFAKRESGRDYYEKPQWNDPKFAADFAATISPTLSRYLSMMASGFGPEILVIRDFPVDDPLPLFSDLSRNVREKSRNSEAILTGIATAMAGSLQREESSHQNGFIQQIYPVNDYKVESSGRGSAPLPFHVENVFIEKAPSFLALACLAGQKGVKTEYLAVTDILKFLSADEICLLSQPKYKIFSGDGFSHRVLLDAPVFDVLANGWVMSRIYEEDRILSDCPIATTAIVALKKAIAQAKLDHVKGIELEAGVILLISNGLAKRRIGGVLHGRKGQIADVNNVSNETSQRWLQRVCIEVPYL
ncbi:MAG: hypothetical protein ABJP33_14635 [Pseudoruegeria sp.]